MVIYNLPGSFLSQYWWIPMSSSVQLNVNTLNDEHGTRNRTQLVKQGLAPQFLPAKAVFSVEIQAQPEYYWDFQEPEKKA